MLPNFVIVFVLFLHVEGGPFFLLNLKGAGSKEPTPFLFQISVASLVSVGKTGTEGGLPTGTEILFCSSDPQERRASNDKP